MILSGAMILAFMVFYGAAGILPVGRYGPAIVREDDPGAFQFHLAFGFLVGIAGLLYGLYLLLKR